MKFSDDTERLLTKPMRKEIESLLGMFKDKFPNAPISEGAKFTLHLEFDGINNVILHTRLEIGADDYFTGYIMGKPKTILFFVPLFDYAPDRYK